MQPVVVSLKGASGISQGLLRLSTLVLYCLIYQNTRSPLYPQRTTELISCDQAIRGAREQEKGDVTVHEIASERGLWREEGGV